MLIPVHHTTLVLRASSCDVEEECAKCEDRETMQADVTSTHSPTCLYNNLLPAHSAHLIALQLGSNVAKHAPHQLNFDAMRANCLIPTNPHNNPSSSVFVSP